MVLYPTVLDQIPLRVLYSYPADNGRSRIPFYSWPTSVSLAQLLEKRIVLNLADSCLASPRIVYVFNSGYLHQVLVYLPI